MGRTTGTYVSTAVAGERFQAFVPKPLPPSRPALSMGEKLSILHDEAIFAIARLDLAGAMVESYDWFIYGFVRKEALISSQIEGTQATLEEVVTYEVNRQSDRPADVEEVCNYVDALSYARREINKKKGLPLSIRLLCEAHKRLMRGVRGKDKRPGVVRTSQNWIGGKTPASARFVPPPPNKVRKSLDDLEKWIHAEDPLPPLIRIGLAHVQFETIHPFLDGNGRIGRLLITLLVEHWKLLETPLLYLSLAFKRRQQEYYRRLSAVRSDGDFEGWTAFFLECVRESADDGVRIAKDLFEIVSKARKALVSRDDTTANAIRLFESLPRHPIVTLQTAIDLTDTTKPTAGKAIEVLCSAGILKETTGKKRDRVYAFRRYLDALSSEPGETRGA